VAPDLLFPSGRAGVDLEILQRLREGAMDATAVHENCTKDGRIITCQWYPTPLLDPEGRFVGVICLGQDITQQKALEERLRQSQKMEALGQVAAGIAHDFSGFATAINVCTYLLTELLKPNAEALRLVEEINKVVARLTSLARELLAINSQQVMVPRLVSPNDVVRDAEEMLRRVLPDDIALRIALDPLTDLVKVDPEQLQRVIFNLVVNARDAMPQGGTLTIETRNQPLDEAECSKYEGISPGHFAVLTVTDSGSGMSYEVKQRIFEPFFTTKERGGVSGLGLAVVDSIIKQSGGHVVVTSEPGHGASFEIYLPRA
jgi:signal transduction histidine kinase